MKIFSIILSLIIASSSYSFGLSQQDWFGAPATISLQDEKSETPRINDVEFTLLPSSRLWIEGTTSINSFDCEAQNVVLDAMAAAWNMIHATVDVAVAKLECGRGRMNRELRRAMGADEHPAITYRLSSASQIEQSAADSVSINAIGYLTMAGVERKVELLAAAFQSDDGSYHLSGSLPIRMTDYSIIPPRAFRGLIKVRDEIVVQFDLIIKASTT